MAFKHGSRRSFLKGTLGISSGAVLLPGCLGEPLLGSDEWELASISSMEIETWTQDADNAGTGGRVDCTVTFDDGRAFTKQLAGDMQRGQRQRRALSLADVQSVLSGQTASSVRSLTFRLASSDMWKCNGVCLRINGVVVLSRTAVRQIENGQAFTIALRKDGRLDGLEVLLSTADEDYAGTDDRVYGNVVFGDGSTLFPSDFYLHSTRNDWERGDTYAYPLYLPSSANDPNTGLTTKSPADVRSFSISQPGANGWILAGAYLLANASPAPLLGNGAIHQRLGAEDRILRVTRWSSATLLGPVLGHLSASTASVVVRAEQEGTYKLKLFSAASTLPIAEDTRQLYPAATFRFGGLAASTRYTFRLYRVTGAGEVELPQAAGAFATYPSEATGAGGVRFSFAAGSCLSPGDDVDQLAWDGISAAAFDPANPVAGNDVRFFVHLGDTFYFYDEVLLTEPKGKAGMVAGHLSNRTHPRFLAMARKVPCCAIWDDHDFRKNNTDSVGMSQERKDLYRDTFLEYWGNPAPANAAAFGLTTRLTYGDVDVYLMDGRYNRRRTAAPTQCFSAATIDWVLGDIDARGPGRLRILASGSPWDYSPSVSPSEYDPDKYGSANYAVERTNFYAALAARIAAGTIKGLVFLTGERHLNKVFEVPLASSGLVAPQFMFSPLGDRDPEPFQNTSLGAKWDAPASRHGFGRVHIDTTTAPWTLRVQFYDTNVAPPAYYYSRTYTLVTNAAGGGEFRWAQSG